MSTTYSYTLSLHDALPICPDLGDVARVLPDKPFGDRRGVADLADLEVGLVLAHDLVGHALAADRKSTRLNSSHVAISYAVFCLKKKNKKEQDTLAIITTDM